MVKMVNIVLETITFLPRLFKICERRSRIFRRAAAVMYFDWTSGPEEKILSVFSGVERLAITVSWP